MKKKDKINKYLNSKIDKLLNDKTTSKNIIREQPKAIYTLTTKESEEPYRSRFFKQEFINTRKMFFS